MTMSFKKSRLFKLFAVVALVAIMAIGAALPSYASSTDTTFYFTTAGGSGEAFINPARAKENTSSIYCWIQSSTNSSVKTARVNARGGRSQTPGTTWSICNSSLSKCERSWLQICNAEFLVYLVFNLPRLVEPGQRLPEWRSTDLIHYTINRSYIAGCG